MSRPRNPIRLLVAVAWYLPLLVVAIGLTTAWLAGWRLQVVETGSMAPELPVDALVVTGPVAPRSIGIGDVIAFEDEHQAGRTVLHRVVEVDARDGRLPRFVTQGDANAAPDAGALRAGFVQGRVLWSVPRLGAAVRFLYELPAALRWGLFVGLPAGLGLAAECRRFRAGRAAAGVAISAPTPV